MCCDDAPMRRPLLVLLALLLLPATASAKLTPLPGTGETPAVEVDAAGTALVAWYLQQPSGEAIALCRIPARSRACPAPQILDATQGATSGVQPPVMRIDGPNVSLVAARQYVVSMQSADGGATFGPHGADQLGHLLHRRDRGRMAPSRSASARGSRRRGSAGRSRRAPSTSIPASGPSRRSGSPAGGRSTCPAGAPRGRP